jgi:hypothetical protein
VKPIKFRGCVVEVCERHATIQVDIQAGEQRSEAFLAINPIGKLPALGALCIFPSQSDAWPLLAKSALACSNR